MHLIITKEVISPLSQTLKREKPFVIVFLKSCQFWGRHAVISCYICKKITQRDLMLSKLQFMHLISTKEV